MVIGSYGYLVSRVLYRPVCALRDSQYQAAGGLIKSDDPKKNFSPIPSPSRNSINCSSSTHLQIFCNRSKQSDTII